MEERKYFPKYGIIGFFIIIFSEIGLLLQVQFFKTFMTPLCWTGMILLVDAWNCHLAGNSYLTNRRKEFFWMALWSIGLWYIFEFYNLYLRNWHYIGLPRSVWLRYFGFFWSFATIWPGVLEIYELVANYRLLGKVRIRPIHLSGRLLTASFVVGLVFVSIPFWVSPKAATYMAAPVWLGMIFLLDPLNFTWKQESLWRDLARGDLSRLLQLLLSGIIAGFLWEFWNYWAAAKWIYTVPILGHIKIFEMPVIGYLGFPPFAVEIFVMWQTVRFILRLK